MVAPSSPVSIPISQHDNSLLELVRDVGTPETKERYVNAKIHIQQQKAEKQLHAHEWRSCCLTADKNVVIFGSQMGVLTGLLIFSAAMLATAESCEASNMYLSLLTMVLGILMPNPRLK